MLTQYIAPILSAHVFKDIIWQAMQQIDESFFPPAEGSHISASPLILFYLL